VNTRRGFDLRSTSLALLALTLQTLDLALLEQALSQETAEAPGLFDKETVVVDLAEVRDATEPLRADELLALLRRHGLLPLAARARVLAHELGGVTFEHVRRENNVHADRLANTAMDDASMK